MLITDINHIINVMTTKKLARALVVTGTIGGVLYVIQTIVNLII